ncbi:hypothetical protein SAMN05216325_13310 [Nitrosomonas marina]|uniref:Uncharacterized protein n=2 Tax=Nitrosomonas marina TaxID=917 RepID=A0A1H8IHR6_9PROT|nr:hypothetical protein SAMN05216325_13310 [Nitrosomonas marina]
MFKDDPEAQGLSKGKAMNYWETCIQEAFEDAGIEATKEQIDTVVCWVEGAHENYGMAHGHDAIPNPLQAENEQLKRELKRQMSKIICPECKGSGWEFVAGPVHSGMSSCHKCRGEGLVTA